jgi:hypothetical protein
MVIVLFSRGCSGKAHRADEMGVALIFLFIDDAQAAIFAQGQDQIG